MMWIFVLLLTMGLMDVSVGQGYSSFQWLSRLRGRRQNPSWQTEDVNCPLECDCPPAYPTAMYCNNRNLRHVPYVQSQIKYVYLQYNKIAGIQDGVFDNATNLVWIVMSHNHLNSDKISKNVFSKLKHLRRLFLNDNELSSVPENLPRSLTDLQLSHNKITKVQTSSLEGMTKLSTLYLQGNLLQDTQDGFKGLNSLALLDMSRNKLKGIPKNLPGALQQLYLEFNNIQNVPPGFLASHPKLQFLRLAHNVLKDEGLPSNVFNVSTLVELDLSFNKLERIPVVSRDLENLYLQANKIKEFSLASFCGSVDMTNFSKLKMLRLDANEINAKDIPAEAAYCLRRVAFIDV